MIRGRLALAALLVLAPAVAMAVGPEVRRVTPPQRPYIVEIGEPRPLSSQALDHERKRNRDLDDYVQFYGRPDYAEVQEIAPDSPWDAREVRLYYLKRDYAVSFGHAFISPAVEDFGLVKYQGPMEPVTRDRIVALLTPTQTAMEAPQMEALQMEAPRMEAPQSVEFRPVTASAPAPPGDIELLVQRVEAAADRASVAADRAANASDAASVAADRTVTILEKLVR
jgi:hypothetical protein